jgi:integrase
VHRAAVVALLVRTPQKLTSNKTGETYYKVRYRLAGQQKALTFWGPEAFTEADEFAKMVDTLGAERARAWWNANLERTETVITLDEWWPRYLAAITKATVGTKLTYDRVYKRVWKMPLGAMPLDTITREHVAIVVNLLSATKSDKTVANAYGVLAGALNRAVRDNIIPTNPVRGLDLPERTGHLETEMRFLTHAEWGDLYDALPEHYRPLFTTLVGTGMRWGEAEALNVADVVLEPVPVVRITKAAKWNASKATREIGPPKTPESKRTVTLPPEVTAGLTPLLGRRGTERLFLAPRGGPLRHRTVYDEWKVAVERADLLPQPRIHDLRHTHVAWLIAAGIPLPVIKARLGHKHISTTIDRYGHLMPDLQAAAANAASLAMQPRGPRELG